MKLKSRLSLDDRVQRGVILLLRILTVVAMMLAIRSGNIEQIVNGMFAVVLVFLPELIERRYKINLPVEYDFLIVLFIYGSLVLGGVRDYYTRIPWWDSMLHLSSGLLLGFAGFLIFYILYLRHKFKVSRGLICFFGFSFALSLGAVWEIFEFIMDQLFKTTMQPGLVDTMRDLILDGAGAFFSVLIGYWFMGRRTPSLFAKMVHSFLDHNPHLNLKA